MKIVEMTGVGVDAMRVAERAEGPVPAGHVRLRVKAATLNYRDLLIAKGFMPIAYPRIPLSDAAGEVVEVSLGVSRVAVGDRVFATFYPDWISGPIAAEKFARDRGGDYDGVACEYLVLPEAELVKLPTHLSDAEAASLPCAGVTAWSAITANSVLTPGASVLIQGTGGVALQALQFALAAGAQVWLISSSDDKLERARKLGAHHLINYKQVPEWGPTVLEQTGGRGVDLVVDVVGTATLGQSVAALANGGRISLLGVQSGFEASLPIYPMMVKSAHIDGIISGNRDAAEAMARAIETHRIKPVIDSSFPMADLPAALHHLETHGHFGKIAIEIG
uniref:Alcohol dehydrogenase n=1 Tax=Sphingomonas sp. JE1 TaxID=1628059 RepID=A0A0D5A062_9SPHN|nr:MULTISPECIES: NAD(P)-dependent alcohol dehydrogenase [unclassified Sphingomonas]AJW29551.1 Alcohol dehydrogenase [Sphingomonas sp. JE1]